MYIHICCVDMYLHCSTCASAFVHVYVYIYIERETARERERELACTEIPDRKKASVILIALIDDTCPWRHI